MIVREEDRRVLLAGVAALGGGIVGAIVAGGVAWAGWEVFTGPHEGWDAFEGVAVALYGGLAGTLPGGLVGVWLAVRRRPAARKTVLYAAAALPLAAALFLCGFLGFGFVRSASGIQPLAFAVLIGVGSGARALALRDLGETPHAGSQ